MMNHMPSLQIRNVPADVYDALAYRARRAGRSLAQQAVAELRMVTEVQARERRLAALEQIEARVTERGEQTTGLLDPEELIRQDRER